MVGYYVYNSSGYSTFGQQGSHNLKAGLQDNKNNSLKQTRIIR